MVTSLEDGEYWTADPCSMMGNIVSYYCIIFFEKRVTKHCSGICFVTNVWEAGGPGVKREMVL
jgi:hypothetical protein